MKTFTRSPILTLAAVIAALAPVPALAGPGPRIKDIVDVQNVRPNQLVGYGLVVGLQGTGDRIRNIPFTEETLQAMLERMGVNIRGTQMLTQNVAAVSVTATMPPFARAGSTIDVQVSALGDASSLQGGTLLVSSLRALDRWRCRASRRRALLRGSAGA
jgi:flagellar P-ring protein precursor FlgI